MADAHDNPIQFLDNPTMEATTPVMDTLTQVVNNTQPLLVLILKILKNSNSTQGENSNSTQGENDVQNTANFLLPLIDFSQNYGDWSEIFAIILSVAALVYLIAVLITFFVCKKIKKKKVVIKENDRRDLYGGDPYQNFKEEFELER